MPITVRVVNDAEFATWVEQAKKNLPVPDAAPPTDDCAAAGATAR